MGQYYRFINLDKKQKCERNLGLLKLTEHSYLNNPYCIDVLSLLNNEWKGDRVIHVGDYAEANDETTTSKIIGKIEKENNLNTKVYTWGQSFEDIKPSKINNNIRYVYNLDKKEYIDLKKQPIQWFCYEKNKISFAKFNFFALLVGCGNEQGGGDYYSNNKQRIGLWAGDRFISSSTLLKEYENYTEIKYIFNEWLPIENRIKNINENTERRIFFNEGVSLKHFLDKYKNDLKLDFSKVELDKEDLTDKEFNYLNSVLKKYKIKELNKQNLKESIIKSNCIDNSIKNYELESEGMEL